MKTHMEVRSSIQGFRMAACGGTWGRGGLPPLPLTTNPAEVTCRRCRRNLKIEPAPLKPLPVPWAERLRSYFEATSRERP